MNAADVMTTDVVSAAPGTPLAELIHLMLDNRISAIPVLEHGRIIGIVSEGDLVRRAETGTEVRRPHWLEMLTSGTRLAADYARTHGRQADEVMTRDVVTVTETTPLADIVQLFVTRRIRRVPVVREGRVGRHRQPAGSAAGTRQAPRRCARQQGRHTIRDAFLAEVRKQPWAAWPVEVRWWYPRGSCICGGLRPTRRSVWRCALPRRTFRASAAVEDHMDHARDVDPMDRPNWPKPAPAVAAAESAASIASPIACLRVIGACTRSPWSVLRPGNSPRFSSSSRLLDRFLACAGVRVGHHRVGQ